MNAIRLSGDPSAIGVLEPQLVAAGFRVSTDATCFLHVGSAADCPKENGLRGLLLASAIEVGELELLSAGAVDVALRTAPLGEIVARLRRVTPVQEQLRQAADLIGHLQDGVVVVDREGRVLMMNQTGTLTLDEPERTQGELLIQLAWPTDRKLREQLINAVSSGQVLSNIAVEVRLQGGRKATVELSSGPLNHGAGCAVISFRDVTVARHTEMELRKTRDFLQHLVEGSSDAIIASDMRGRLVVFNAAAERLFDIPAKYAREKVNVIDLYPQGGAREMMRLLRDAPNHHIEAVRSYGMTRKGELVPIEVSASLVKMNGAEVATVGLLRDLRERVRVEGELARTRAKLIDAEKQSAITALAGATAHEMNQPLTVILGYIDLLKRKADPSQLKPIEAITVQAERMAEIVRRISKLTHVEVLPYPGRLQIADLDQASERPTVVRSPR